MAISLVSIASVYIIDYKFRVEESRVDLSLPPPTPKHYEQNPVSITETVEKDSFDSLETKAKEESYSSKPLKSNLEDDQNEAQNDIFNDITTTATPVMLPEFAAAVAKRNFETQMEQVVRKAPVIGQPFPDNLCLNDDKAMAICKSHCCEDIKSEEDKADKEAEQQDVAIKEKKAARKSPVVEDDEEANEIFEVDGKSKNETHVEKIKRKKFVVNTIGPEVEITKRRLVVTKPPTELYTTSYENSSQVPDAKGLRSLNEVDDTEPTPGGPSRTLQKRNHLNNEPMVLNMRAKRSHDAPNSVVNGLQSLGKFVDGLVRRIRDTGPQSNSTFNSTLEDLTATLSTQSHGTFSLDDRFYSSTEDNFKVHLSKHFSDSSVQLTFPGDRVKKAVLCSKAPSIQLPCQPRENEDQVSASNLTFTLPVGQFKMIQYTFVLSSQDEDNDICRHRQSKAISATPANGEPYDFAQYKVQFERQCWRGS